MSHEESSIVPQRLSLQSPGEDVPPAVVETVARPKMSPTFDDEVKPDPRPVEVKPEATTEASKKVQFLEPEKQAVLEPSSTPPTTKTPPRVRGRQGVGPVGYRHGTSRPREAPAC